MAQRLLTVAVPALPVVASIQAGQWNPPVVLLNAAPQLAVGHQVIQADITAAREIYKHLKYSHAVQLVSDAELDLGWARYQQLVAEFGGYGPSSSVEGLEALEDRVTMLEERTGISLDAEAAPATTLEDRLAVLETKCAVPNAEPPVADEITLTSLNQAIQTLVQARQRENSDHATTLRMLVENTRRASHNLTNSNDVQLGVIYSLYRMVDATHDANGVFTEAKLELPIVVATAEHPDPFPSAGVTIMEFNSLVHPRLTTVLQFYSLYNAHDTVQEKRERLRLYLSRVTV